MNVPKLVAFLATAAVAVDGVRAEEESGSSSITLYVVIGVVVLLFVAAAIFVWMRSRNRGRESNEIPTHMDQTPHQIARQTPHRNNQQMDGQYNPYKSPHVNNGPPRQERSYQPNNGDGRQPHQRTPPHREPNNNGGSRVNNAQPGPRQPYRDGNPGNNGNRRPAPGPNDGKKNGKQQQQQQKIPEVTNRVLAEFQADPALCRRKVPYAALYFTRVLSKGAFGEVWLAQLENRQVAVKRILNEKKNDEKEIECFAAEIKLMASFYHPKIVEFVGVSWSTLQDLCAVTEYMAKGDLYGFLKRKNGQLNWRDHKIYLAEDVADALGYLHSLAPKVIHRDLKSKNILLDDTFRAKLSDFGISRERSLEETMTAGVGTIYWTAPEVLMGKKYTEKADIYSFGIVMSELDTHEVPYSDMRDEAGKKLQGMKIVQQVIKKKLRPSFAPNCPSKVRELAMRCLDAEPDVRPDALELLHLIQRIQQKL